ncbi:MAG: lytic transglycosylase domain-containing protein [Planctomycetes bacterium]|nr:lytic transglycosylase domain-containing protein [Planctomycetota bacterium]
MKPSGAAHARGLAGSARRWLVLAVVLVLIGTLLFEMRRPLARAANEARREVSESAGVTRVEGHAMLLRLVGEEVGLDPHLLAGLVFVESRGKVGALSGAEALGLFQLKLETAVERAVLLGLEAPTREQLLEDAELNALLGAHHLKWLLERYDGDLERALVAYNAGSGRVDRWSKSAGGWSRWRDAAESSGRSDVLGYVADVLHWRDFFVERATIFAPIGPPAPARAAASAAASDGELANFVGPTVPSSNHGAP